MQKPVRSERPDELYERDFFEWTQQQAALVAAGRWENVDRDNLVDEIEAMGRSERREIGNRLARILQHLLKWEHQPERRTYSWRETLSGQRLAIEILVAASPSLKAHPAQALELAYRRGKVRAALETGLLEESFPSQCPYTIEEALDFRFHPGPAEPRID